MEYYVSIQFDETDCDVQTKIEYLEEDDSESRHHRVFGEKVVGLPCKPTFEDAKQLAIEKLDDLIHYAEQEKKRIKNLTKDHDPANRFR